MKSLGTVFRYFLNINTIWGFMILISFGFCLYQHYTPESVRIRNTAFEDGNNQITITVTDRDEKEMPYNLPVTFGGGALVINDDQPSGEDIKWTFSTRKYEDYQLLQFKVMQDGKPVTGTYKVMVGETRVDADGKLVTLNTMTDAAFNYAQTGFEIAIGLVAPMVLFLGLMKVGEDAGIVQLVARAVYPIIRFLFPQVPKDHPANGAILMNVTTTILGLGNAATPFGLKAMKELQNLNPHKEVASDSQIMLLAYNTAGLALLPTTLIALRKSAGAAEPFNIILPCLIAGAVSTVVAITMVKVLSPLPIFSLQSALAEESADEQEEAKHEAEQKAEEEQARREEEAKAKEDNQ
jgi:spore maturation protein A